MSSLWCGALPCTAARKVQNQRDAVSVDLRQGCIISLVRSALQVNEMVHRLVTATGSHAAHIESDTPQRPAPKIRPAPADPPYMLSLWSGTEETSSTVQSTLHAIYLVGY